jgi:hypothetical protein
MTMRTTGAELQTEAAIYAEGTDYTARELVIAYNSYCDNLEEQDQAPDDFQRWAEREGHN